MLAFLDFEASSLGKDSYPIEVAWVFVDGRSESHLIRPAPHWRDWDPRAEQLHGIGRAVLEAEGEPYAVVARRVLQALSGRPVVASAPSWDGKWLSVLLRSGGLPRHALRLGDSRKALVDAAARALEGKVEPGVRAGLAAGLARRVRAEYARHPPRHRALEDALQERAMWLEVGRRATRLAARGG